MNKLTVGQFTDSLFPIIDGVGYVAQNYGYWLNKEYCNAYIIGPSAPKYVESDPTIIRFPTIPIPGFSPFRCGIPQVGEFRKRLDAIDFDIVHFQAPFISASEAIRVAKKKDIPLVATFQSKYKNDFSRIFKSKLVVDALIKHVVSIFNQADEVWAPSEPTADVLHEYGYKKEIKIIPNGTDMKALSATEILQRKKQIRKMHNIKEEDFVLLYVGQHRFEKNLRLTIDALHAINQKGCDVKTLFIGTGPDEKEMKKLVSQYDLDDKVTFVGIIKDRDLLQSYFASSDALIFPSIYDMASLTMREAASCAVPTIVVEGSTTSKGIIDEVNGFLVQNSVDSLSAKVMHMKDHLPLVREAGLHAQTSVFLSWDNIVGLVYDGYLDLLKKKQGNL